MARKLNLLACVVFLIFTILPVRADGARELRPGDKVTLETKTSRIYKDVKVVEISKAYILIEENGRTFRVPRSSLNEKSQERFPSAVEIESRERAQKEYLARIKNDPQFHYDHVIKDKFALHDGKLVAMKTCFGRIIQVVDADTILFREDQPDRMRVSSMGRMGASFGGERPLQTRSTRGVVAVTGRSTEGRADGDPTGFPGLAATGTYSYTNSQGVKRTVRQYSVLTSITFEEYMKLREAGVNLPTGKPPAGFGQ